MSFHKKTAIPDPMVSIKPRNTKDMSSTISSDMTANNLASVKSSVVSTYVPAPSTTPNWSGYENYNSNNTWCGAEGYFTQPYNPNSNSSAKESSWIGLGGDNYSPLSQAGTCMNECGAYAGFFECIGSNNQNNMDFFNSNGSNDLAVHGGDHMYVYISYQSSNNLFNYYIADNSTNYSTRALITPTDDNTGCIFDSYCGKYVEWIDERPSMDMDGDLYDLLNFGTVNWTNCRSYTNTQVWNPINASPCEQIDMVRTGDPKTKLTNVTDLSSNGMSFVDTWERAS